MYSVTIFASNTKRHKLTTFVQESYDEFIT